MQIYPRSLKQSLRSDLDIYPVVVVMGARQVGKSTLCQEIAEECGFGRRTLDDRDVRDQALNDPEGLLAGLGERGGFIDEVQRAPDLLLAIKAVVDREKRPGKYLLSGSNQPRVGRAVSESLLGRATYRTLRPLTLSELRLSEDHLGWSFLFGNEEPLVIDELQRRAAASGPLDWREIVRTGGFPRVVGAPPEQRLRLLDDYIEIFANRDIREIVAVESSTRFETFIRVIGARTAHELNASGISRDLGVSVSTIGRWIDALRRSYLVETVPPYTRNAGRRQIRAPKIFVVDAALALAAARENEPTGFHMENLVASDLHVWKEGGPTRDVYHWREASGQEIDFILEDNNSLVAVEVKTSEEVGVREARHLLAFQERYEVTRRCVLVSCDPRIRVIAPRIIACPWWAIF
jgi:uncharacterized protein